MPDNDPLQVAEAKSSKVSDWITTFAEQRKLIEQGIRDRLPTKIRIVRLNEADSALPQVELPDSDGLQRIADQLERKLQEMLDVVLSGGSSDIGVRLPPNFAPVHDTEALREPICVDERMWLFKGGVQEILYRFRDQGWSLILEERDKLLGRLSAGVLRIQLAVKQLNDHPVVAQALDVSEVVSIEQTLSSVRALVDRYKVILTSRDEGVASLLENNYYQLQGQFIASCAQLCLQLYGNVSHAHLGELLDLKSAHLPIVDVGESSPAAAAEAQRKRLERKRNLVLRRVMIRAQKEKWPTWPILQLYKYDPRFGRARPREIHQSHDEGFDSKSMPTDRSGNPLAGGW